MKHQKCEPALIWFWKLFHCIELSTYARYLMKNICGAFSGSKWIPESESACSQYLDICNFFRFFRWNNEKIEYVGRLVRLYWLNWSELFPDMYIIVDWPWALAKHHTSVWSLSWVTLSIHITQGQAKHLIGKVKSAIFASKGQRSNLSSWVSKRRTTYLKRVNTFHLLGAMFDLPFSNTQHPVWLLENLSISIGHLSVLSRENLEFSQFGFDRYSNYLWLKLKTMSGLSNKEKLAYFSLWSPARWAL